MKRAWTAAVLLALVITGCLYNSCAVSRTAARISAPLTQAMCCASPARAQAHLTAVFARRHEPAAAGHGSRGLRPLAGRRAAR